MKYSVKLDETSGWDSFGPWFESFVDLATKLYIARKMGHRYSKILIGVPKSEFVALALSIGFSRSAFLQGDNFAEPVLPEDISLGDVIELRSGWDKNPDSRDDRLPKCTVGRISEITKENEYFWKFTFDFASNFSSEPRRFKRARTTGNMHSTDLNRLFKVPKGTPERPDFSKKRREVSGTRSKETRMYWEGWDYQINPALVIFGATGRLEDYKKPQMKDEELHPKLEIESDSLFNVARLDNLTNDVNPHFINAVEQISKFPEKGSATYETFERFPFACLDGNQALLLLSEEPAFDKKCLIGIWEMSGHHHQSESARSFAKVASTFTQIENFSKDIGWNPPPGIQIWGWK
jgi:hypothetical protein